MINHPVDFVEEKVVPINYVIYACTFHNWDNYIIYIVDVGFDNSIIERKYVVFSLL
jgi:hypothetical protein